MFGTALKQIAGLHTLGWGQLTFAMMVGLLPGLSAAQRPTVFYAIGAGDYISPENQHPSTHDKDVRLYEIDRTNLRIIRSISVETQSGMLTGNGDAIVLADSKIGDSAIMLVASPQLVVESEINLKSLHVHGAECVDHIFIHPVTNLAYFSCDSGRRGNGFVILNVLKQSVVGDFSGAPPAPPGWPGLSLFKPHFAYDGQSHRLYVVGEDVMILDPQNHPVDYILARDIAAGSGLEVGKIRYMIRKVAVLPNGTLAILISDGYTPSLVIYDPLQRKPLRHWTETHKYAERETYTDPRTGKPFDKPVQRVARLHHGPVPSRDGFRLFAMSEGDIVLWDSHTLEELDRFDAPEPPGETDQCFLPAPDGHGMWFIGKSGSIYRLDDHTGKVTQKVKIPFRFLGVILEP